MPRLRVRQFIQFQLARVYCIWKYLDTLEADFELARTPTAACLTVRLEFSPVNIVIMCHCLSQLLWSYGDREYQAKRWSNAAEWYLAGTHQIFRSLGQISISKCFRKAALCYIQLREYALASAVIRRCPSNEATTHYVILLTAVDQGSFLAFPDVLSRANGRN
jgi:hypothetical protein